MPLQYILDNEGNNTAVLIPISEWELLTNKHAYLKALEVPNKIITSKKASDFAGSMPTEIADAFNKYVDNTRNTWS